MAWPDGKLELATSTACRASGGRSRPKRCLSHWLTRVPDSGARKAKNPPASTGIASTAPISRARNARQAAMGAPGAGPVSTEAFGVSDIYSEFQPPMGVPAFSYTSAAARVARNKTKSVGEYKDNGRDRGFQ